MARRDVFGEGDTLEHGPKLFRRKIERDDIVAIGPVPDRAEQMSSVRQECAGTVVSDLSLIHI